MKAEPDLSIVQSEFSVRYECQQSLQIDVNEVYSGSTPVHGFYILYVSKHVTSLVI